jgi:ATP-dependent DNA helicase 2 subunit 2
MIDNATKGAKGNPLKYERRVIIVTDGRGEMDTDDLEQMTSKIKDTDAPFEIVLLGVDFDDPDVGYKEEGKDPHKVLGILSGSLQRLISTRQRTKRY